MTISVIIPTYNGAHKLPILLEALMQQIRLPDEIVIAIDGSTDNTIAVLEGYKKKVPNLSVLVSENGGRSVIRNKGMKRAVGDLLIFFDDDMIPDISCVQVHADHHLKHPSSILTGAQIDIADKSRTDIQAFKNFLSTKWLKKLNTDKPLQKQNLFITAANFSLSKKLFEKLGGFDERLKDAEDFDLAVRAYTSGIPMYYNHTAFAWHNDIINCASYIKRQRQYSEAHKKLMALKPWLVDQGFIQPSVKPAGFRKKIFCFFSSKRWIKAIDKGHLKLLPRALRYRLYDIIITANGVYFPDRVVL